MRLKTLEIKGFKSFADKTILHFDKGVTGVIGPNGCGKSNIIDAVRWAIGEHKISALRSDKMAGLIFNGSKSRSSSGLAEVALTFENTRNLLPTEFTTVTVHRRYFKNGDSEYRLNDVACRLKDIHNLFLDTGISSDTYAIIELAMVDEIIKDKENSRRKMLEQAAGVSIYKTRKKEAQNKLKATEQDLSRIEDLLYEIEGNLKSLEGQARKATRFFNLKDKYKASSIEFAKASMEGFHETFKTLTERQQKEEDGKRRIDTDITQTDAAIEKLKLTSAEQEKELQERQRIFNHLKDNIQEKENDKRLALQRLEYAGEQNEQMNDFLTGADERLKELQQGLAEKEKITIDEKINHAKLEKDLEELQELKEDLKEIYEDKKADREAKRKEQQATQQHRFNIEKRIAVTETSIQNLQQSIARLEDENLEKQEELSEQREGKEEIEEQLETDKEKLETLIRHQKSTQENILSVESEIAELRTKSIDENRILDAKKNEYQLLKSMVDNLEGYPESIKFLKKNKEWNTTAPILSDIIFCKKEYRPAIEGFLEPYLNYYVVEKLADAVSAIRLLDSNEKGKANFFLLDKFEEHRKTSQKIDAGIAAVDIVEVTPKYQPLVAELLKNVYLSEDISEGEEILKENKDWIFIEKSGKQYRSYHRIGGGAAGVFEGNKLGRAKSLEKLQKEILQKEKETEALQEKMQQKKKQISEYKEQLDDRTLDSVREEVNHLQNQIFGFQNKFENTKALISSNENRLSERRDTLSESHEKIETYREELADFSENDNSILTALEDAENDFIAADRKYNEISTRCHDLAIRCTQQQSHVRSLEQETEYKKSRLIELEKQIKTNIQKREKAEETIQSTKEVIIASEDELHELALKQEKEQQQLNEKRQEYDQIKNKIGEQEKALRQMQKDRSEVEDGLGGLREKVNELKLQLAGMRERLDVEFNIQLEDIIEEEREGAEDIAVLKEQTEKYKSRLERMGEVNPTAIEAFEEIKKRYDFIATQKKDLIEARDSLEKTIKEVEDTANGKFLDTFHQVKENFIKVFKTLFTEEDKADMYLSNLDDISNTGVEIVAQPKGKRPTVITQLSGGEKTLTAIALLFAIYLIKPAPFCILDEVDAPLDDANVGKFTNMIREFSENSQFIVVTHNKQTMAAVDVIYGVTMQEVGVSKLVPVDFRSLEMKN